MNLHEPITQLHLRAVIGPDAGLQRLFSVPQQHPIASEGLTGAPISLRGITGALWLPAWGPAVAADFSATVTPCRPEATDLSGRGQCHTLVSGKRVDEIF